MTRSFLVIACGGVLLAPGAGHASERPAERAVSAQQCECRVFARMYATRPSLRARIDRRLKREGVAAPPRRRFKRVVYDYDRTGDFKERFCKRHRRVCRAAAKCIFHAGLALVFYGLDGEWSRADMRVAAGACAVAAADSLVFKQVRSVVRSSLLFGLFFGPGYFILGGDDASFWLILLWIVVATCASSMIDRWLERRAAD